MAAPFWIKLAASELVRHKLISYVRTYPRYLAVHYKSGVTDKYYFKGKLPLGSFKVEESDLRIGSEIPIERTYELNPLNSVEQVGCAHHFSINKKYLRAGTFIDRRMAIHRFVAKFNRSQLSLDRYPDRSVGKWIDELREFNYSTMISSDAFNFYKLLGYKVPWRQVLWQFFPPSLNCSPRRATTLLTDGLSRRPSCLDTTVIIRGVLREASGRTLNPLAYCAILERFGARKAVIDLHPEKGYKAIACGLLGIPYIYRACDEMDLALDRRISEVLGLICEPLSGQQADVLLSDNHFERFDIKGATPYLDRVNTMVAYVPRADRLRLMVEYKPTKIVKVLCRYVQGRRFKRIVEDPDFVFIW